MPDRQPRAHGGSGRVAQRRRTRRAIVEAAAQLLAADRTPSVAEIAEAADVSRRTVYAYFPTLEQLLIDATAGALSNAGIDEALDPDAHGNDVRARVDALVRTLLDLSTEALPLGRRLIGLTVDTPPEPQPFGAARRGYRRIEWIERAVEPLRDQLGAEQFERLVSGLALVIGWEAMIVLRDVRGLGPGEEEKVTTWAARALIDAMLAESHGPKARPSARSAGVKPNVKPPPDRRA